MVRKMHAKEGLSAEHGMRIGVVGGGCSGFQYSLNFDTQKEGDRVTDFGGVMVLRGRNFAAVYRGHDARLRRGIAWRGIPLRQSAREPHLRMRVVVQRVNSPLTQSG